MRTCSVYWRYEQKHCFKAVQQFLFTYFIFLTIIALSISLSLLRLTEVVPLVSNLQLLSGEMCDKNKVLLQPSALGQYTGHFTAMQKQSGIPCPVQGQLNNRCSGRKEALLLTDLGIQPSNLTVIKQFPQTWACCCLLIKQGFFYDVYKAVWAAGATTCLSNHNILSGCWWPSWAGSQTPQKVGGDWWS